MRTNRRPTAAPTTGSVAVAASAMARLYTSCCQKTNGTPASATVRWTRSRASSGTLQQTARPRRGRSVDRIAEAPRSGAPGGPVAVAYDELLTQVDLSTAKVAGSFGRRCDRALVRW